MSYAFQSPRAQQASTSLPPSHEPYSHDSQRYEPYSASWDQSHGHYGDTHDSHPSRALHRDSDDQYIDTYADHRAGAAAVNDPNMTSEKSGYGSPYASKRASGNSIWTKDDKRAFQSRSCPAKLFRIIIGNLILAIIFIVSIILLIVMFLRPPNVAISGVSVPSQNGVSYQNGAFSFNVSVDISISNPNSISASLSKLKATAYDSQDQTTALGHGEITNQKIKRNDNTTIVFPFQIQYDQSQDSDLSIIRNIASDCGLSLSGGSSSGSGDLSFLFKIEVDVEVLSITVPVNVNRNVSFPCPLSGTSLQGVLSGLGSAFGVGRRALLGKGTEGEGVTEGIVRRQLEKVDVVDLASWKGDMSAVELVAAAADGFVRRYSPVSSGGAARLADQHDAL